MTGPFDAEVSLAELIQDLLRLAPHALAADDRDKVVVVVALAAAAAYVAGVRPPRQVSRLLGHFWSRRSWFDPSRPGQVPARWRTA